MEGLFARYPGNEKADKLLEWVMQVEGQHTGDMETMVKFLLGHQPEAENTSAKIREIRQSLMAACKKVGATDELYQTELHDVTRECNDAYNRQKTRVPAQGEFKAHIKQGIVRYAQALAAALTYHGTVTKAGEDIIEIKGDTEAEPESPARQGENLPIKYTKQPQPDDDDGLNDFLNDLDLDL